MVFILSFMFIHLYLLDTQFNVLDLEEKEVRHRF